MKLLKTLQIAKKQQKKLIAILVDPDKISVDEVSKICAKVNNAPVDFLLLGGSYVCNQKTEIIAQEIKKYIKKPVVLFPGSHTHLTSNANALLFLSLISGDNPEYLIHQQIKSVPFLTNSSLETIPTGYILIDGGTETSTMKVSNTQPISQENIEHIKNTAKAGELMGKQLVYLEAGSGAIKPVKKHVIKAVFNSLNIPIIVGGGIQSLKMIEEAHNAGATLVVIGTAFENKKLFNC